MQSGQNNAHIPSLELTERRSGANKFQFSYDKQVSVLYSAFCAFFLVIFLFKMAPMGHLGGSVR